MQVSTALLCDAASVRENLLFVLGGGITRLTRADLPAAMNVSLAITISLHRMEIGRPHELAVDVISDDGERAAEIRGAFQVPEVPQDLGMHEEILLPIVLPFTNVALPSHGGYSIEIGVDGHHERSIPFKVVPPPPNPVAT